VDVLSFLQLPPQHLSDGIGTLRDIWTDGGAHRPANVWPPLAGWQTRVQRYFDAWNSGDIAALRATLAPSVEYFNTSNETVKAGVDAVTEVPVLLSGMMPDRKLTLLGAPVANGDQVAVQWSFKATHPSGVKGQGPVTFRGASFFRIEQGRIVWIGDYYNHATLERQLAR
jgi:ketosteroid isomerase-like protein